MRRSRPRWQPSRSWRAAASPRAVRSINSRVSVWAGVTVGDPPPLEITFPTRPVCHGGISFFFRIPRDYGHPRLLQARGGISSASMRFTGVVHGPDLDGPDLE